MRFRFGLVPVAISATLLAAPACHAETFLTLEQAQQLIFPGAVFTPADLALTDEQAEMLARSSGTTVYRNLVKVWRTSDGGWFFLDQVHGRADRITYAVGLTAEGTVKAVEVLVCDAGYAQVRAPLWRRQFVGKRFSPRHLSNEVRSISGTTLSSAHITDGGPGSLPGAITSRCESLDRRRVRSDRGDPPPDELS